MSRAQRGGARRARTALALAAALVLLAGAAPARGAQFSGRSIDGVLFDAVVLAQETGRRYDVKVEFDGGSAVLLFPACARVELVLDRREVDETGKVTAVDTARGAYWVIEIDPASLSGASDEARPGDVPDGAARD